jgi:cytidine deaminase
LGTKQGFDSVAATISDIWSLEPGWDARSLVESILIKRAVEASENAYAPYSDFKVGAATLCDNGSVYTGCNVENSSYGATICAERVAVSKAVSEGCKKIKAIAVAGGKDGIIDNECAPCGICRQFLSEFCQDGDMKVLLPKDKIGDDYKVYKLSELLPISFGEKNLK